MFVSTPLSSTTELLFEHFSISFSRKQKKKPERARREEAPVAAKISITDRLKNLALQP
jgi:hypothetical protein